MTIHVLPLEDPQQWGMADIGLKEPMQLVLIESPYAGDVDRNMRYLAACERWCLLHGRAPFASHRAYTQALDDNDFFERKLGIEAGYEWGRLAEEVLFFVDYGASEGMRKAYRMWSSHGKKMTAVRLGAERLAEAGLPTQDLDRYEALRNALGVTLLH